MGKFEKLIEVRWADVDQNRHVRHSAYYDYGAHVRIEFFKSFGFSTAKMKDLNIGPIIFKEECTFIKELHQEKPITINVLRGDVKADGSRWVFHHEIFDGEGVKSAHITLKGAWMDLAARKLTVPPKEIGEALNALPKGEEYVHGKK